MTVIGYDVDPSNSRKEIWVQDDGNQQDEVNDPATPPNRRRNTRYTDGAPPTLKDLPTNRVELVISESPKTTATLDDSSGRVTWGEDITDQQPIKDLVPPNGGKLEFFWTIGEFIAGQPPKPHPQYQKYVETNNTDTTKTRRFHRPDDDTIRDWAQTVTGPVGMSKVYGGNIRQNSQWEFWPLRELPALPWRVPDLAPTTGDQEFTIYTAVNLERYITSNPEGFLDGAWRESQTLLDLGVEIVDGQVPGVEGIYWATSDFTFDPDSLTGWVPVDGPSAWLNSVDFQDTHGPIEILAAHETDPIEPLLFADGFESGDTTAWSNEVP